MELSKNIKRHFLKEELKLIDKNMSETEVAPTIKPAPVPTKPKEKPIPEEWDIEKPKKSPTPKG